MRRPAASVLLGATLALPLLFAASVAHAQTSVTLVSNNGQSSNLTSNLTLDRAQAFTTGSSSDGYKLTGIDIQFNPVPVSTAYDVKIYASNSSSQPGSLLGSLTGSAQNGSTVSRTASGDGIDLAASTTYFATFEPVSIVVSGAILRTESDSEDSGAAAGWTLSDGSLWKLTGDSAWSTSTSSWRITIKGFAKSPKLVGNTGVSGAVFDSPFTQDRAQGFRTGSNSAGYKLTRVDLRLKSSASTAPTYSVTVQGDASSLPDGTSLGTLTTSSSLSSSYALLGFYASGDGISLDPSTDYFVVLDVSTGAADTDVESVLSIVNDPDAAMGWTIASGHRFRSNSASAWDSAESTVTLKLNIHGYSNPGVTGVELVSNAGSDRTYGLGEEIRVRLTYSEAVTVTGTPRLKIKMDPSFGEKWADYASGSGTKTLQFAYTVVSMNRSQGGIAVLENTLELNGGTIKFTGETDAPLAHAGLAHDPNHQVDGSSAPPPTTPPPPPPDTPTPGTDPSGGTTEVPRKREPLQLALWTDQSGYRAGETVRLYRTVDPHDDDGDYRTFVYLEQAGGGQRRYMAPLSASGTLHEDAVDHRARPAEAALPRSLSAADRQLIWEGEAPAPGLWQFVMELRPGEPGERSGEAGEPYGTRRAWAKFSVAARSQLLNRRGFDREIREDLTLRGDTLYYLGHQLFVHAGATLTIEPGTTLRAFGRNTAIIVEPGGRIVAEGTRETPVVLGCSSPVGLRRPGCWAGLRILGRAPVTRLEGVAPGVLPAERPVYGGSEPQDSSGVLRYVRVEFAGAVGGDAEAAGPAIGLYGAGSGTVLDHVQAHASLGDGFAFSGGTAVCNHCVASSSGDAGLSWERGWRGGASQLYVQHGSGGLDGLAGGNDEQGHDLEPRSLPTLSNVTLVHASPNGRRERRAVALRLSTGSGVRVSDLLTTHFLARAIDARGRSALLFREGESAVRGALLYRSGPRPLRGASQDAVEFINKDPELRDVRDFANPDPRPKAGSPALPDKAQGYIGAFGRTENWLEEWTVFGPESVYDLRERAEEDD